MAGSPFFAAVQPDSKKPKLSGAAAAEEEDVEMGGMGGGVSDDKATQCGGGGAAAAAAGGGTTGSGGTKVPPPSLESIRQQISEQFDIEILLKHREIRLIEQEVAKTQIAIEQLRRCTLVPYANSPEAQSGTATELPEWAPGPGVVDGPYTRHYKSWLLQHPNFDATVEPFAPPPAPQQQLPMSPPLQVPQQLGATGRPQRQSAMKAQTKTGEQVCLFRKRDGVLVRLECNNCHRSNFSSAQGFINHCRIAHQKEYASHDAAAEDCGHPVDESEQSLILQPPRGAADGPARHTRQTQNAAAQAAAAQAAAQAAAAVTPTPAYMSHSRRNSTPVGATPSAYINPYVLNPGFTPVPATGSKKHRSAATATPIPRKNGAGHLRRHSAHMTTPRTPNHGGEKNSPPTPPLDFSTPHLQGFLKRKRVTHINLEDLVKEVSQPRVDWEHMTLSDEATLNNPPYQPVVTASSRPATPESAAEAEEDIGMDDLDMSDLLHISSDEEEEEEDEEVKKPAMKMETQRTPGISQEVLDEVRREAARIGAPGGAEEEVPKHVRFAVNGMNGVKTEEGLMG